MHRNLGWLTLGALLLGGCASAPLVTSIASDKAQPASPTNVRYVQYVLERSVVTVAIDPASSGDGGSSSTPPPVNVNVTQTNGAPAKPEPAKADAPSLASTCAELRKQYGQDRLVQLRYLAADAAFRAKLKELLVNHRAPLTGDDRDALLVSLEAFLKIAKSGGAAEAEAVALKQVIGSACPIAVKATLTQKDEPDATASYLLMVYPNDLFDDQATFAVGPDGVLKEVSATSVDRSSDVIANAVKSAVSVAELAAGGPAPIGASGSTPTGSPDALLAKLKGSGKTKPPISEADLKAILVALPNPGPRLADLEFRHFERTFALADIADTTIDLPAGVSIKGSCSKPLASTLTPMSIRDPSVAGILIPSGRSCEFEVTASADPNGPVGEYYNCRDAKKGYCSGRDDDPRKGLQTLSRAHFWMLDSKTPSALPLDRTFFVTRTADYKFDGGRVSSVTYNRPSPMVNAALLPFNITGAAVGAITSQLGNRQSITAAKTSYLKAQTDYLSAQTAQLKADQDLEAARKAKTKADQTAAGGGFGP